MSEIYKSLSLLMLTVLISLGLAEGVTRLFFEPRTNEIAPVWLTEGASYKKDEELGWLPKANTQGQHNEQGKFESRFTTNAFGLRDTDHTLEKPEGIDRIVVLGDSFAWGFGVDDGEIFTDYLEAALDKTEVINLGVTAYGITQEIAYLRRLGLKFDPDMVLLALVMNDIYDPANSSTNTSDNHQSSPSDDDKGSFFRKIKDFLSQNLAMYVLFQEATNTNKALVELLVWSGLKEPPAGFEGLDFNLMPALRDYPEQLNDAWEQFEDNIIQLKSICDQNNVRFVVALVPSLQSVDEYALEASIAYTSYYKEDFEMDKPYDRLVNFAQKNQIEIINPLASFRRSKDLGESLYLNGDMHFNKFGHKLFADEILFHISDEKVQ